jgi:hypothetical protein
VVAEVARPETETVGPRLAVYLSGCLARWLAGSHVLCYSDTLVTMAVSKNHWVHHELLRDWAVEVDRCSAPATTTTSPSIICGSCSICSTCSRRVCTLHNFRVEGRWRPIGALLRLRRRLLAEVCWHWCAAALVVPRSQVHWRSTVAVVASHCRCGSGRVVAKRPCVPSAQRTQLQLAHKWHTNGTQMAHVPTHAYV